MHWLCKLKGHDFVYEPPIVYCQRCGEFRHNPTTKPAGIKNTDAEIRDGVWSDSTKAPGANIDAKISNAGVDPAIVRREAGVQGWAKALQQGQPRGMATSVTGGGSVTFDKFGANVSAGTTTGDTARVMTVYMYAPDTLDLIKFVATYSTNYNTPLTDDVEIGLSDTGVNTDVGAYLDLTTQEYHAGATTSAAATPALGDLTVLLIEIDFAAGETRFEQRGGVSESATIAEVNFPYEARINTNSNGTGETLRMQFIKEVYIASK